MKVKLLDPRAKVPTVEHPGSDLGFDLYALEDVVLNADKVVKVRTGIAIEFPRFVGGIIKDRSSMAAKNITVSGGVIDNGYCGEIMVLLTFHNHHFGVYQNLYAGDKIAQLVLVHSFTDLMIDVVDELSDSDRGEKGFGSSGR